jgi:membrane-associated protease RseP (regulator of RpoE activity)
MRFKLFQIPVTVEPLFFVLVVFLGIRRNQIDLIVIWVAVVFVSILVHELGHAFAGRRLGMAPAIRLHGLGGQTEWIAPQRLGRLQQIGISFAGPFAGFLLAGGVYLAQPLFAQAPNWRFGVAYYDLLWVNIGWGILNLLPILPMDGGRILQMALHTYLNRDDDYWPYLISTGGSALAGVFALLLGYYWAAFLASWFCYSGFQVVRAMQPTPFRPA